MEQGIGDDRLTCDHGQHADLLELLAQPSAEHRVFAPGRQDFSWYKQRLEAKANGRFQAKAEAAEAKT